MESTISKNPRYRGEHTQLPFQISMAAYIETQSLSKTVFKPTVWKRYINDISLWDKSKPDIVDFFKFTERVNLHITHWDNLLRHGCIPRHNIQRKMRKSYHWRKDVYTFSPLTTHRMLKWIWPMDLALSILRTNSSEEVFQISKSGWWTEAGHTILKEKLLLEVKLTEGKQRSWNKTTRKKKKYCLSWHNASPLVSIIKEALIKKCNHIQNQPLPCQILKEPLNPRTYTQNLCLHWKAFDLLKKMRNILLMVALLEACDVINNVRHLGFYQKW